MGEVIHGFRNIDNAGNGCEIWYSSSWKKREAFYVIEIMKRDKAVLRGTADSWEEALECMEENAGRLLRGWDCKSLRDSEDYARVMLRAIRDGTYRDPDFSHEDDYYYEDDMDWNEDEENEDDDEEEEEEEEYDE